MESNTREVISSTMFEKDELLGGLPQELGLTNGYVGRRRTKKRRTSQPASSAGRSSFL